MKARIKATGQIIELCPYVYDIDGNDFLLEEVELLDNPNWQEARINAAIAAMPIVADDGYNVRNEQHLIAKYAVQLADALVAELQKEGGEDE